MKKGQSPRRITHSLTVATKPAEASHTAAPTLSARLWDASRDLAEAALASDYIRGIGRGTLDPNHYGHYSLQDVAYCHQGLEDWRAAAARATHPAVKSFAEARVESWTSYVQDTYGEWHIEDPSAVSLCKAARAYADFESEVARTEDPVYAAVVMTPCDRLWSWLAKQLSAVSTESNLYSFWIKENLDDSGAVHLESFIDSQAGSMSETKALAIFRRAMLGEVNFFRWACGQDPLGAE